MPDLEYYGRWTALVALATKIEAGVGQPLGFRTEGDRVFLRGSLKTIALKTLEPGDVVATLPVGARPPATTVIGGLVKVTAAGVINVLANLAEGKELGLDGLSFNLTE